MYEKILLPTDGSEEAEQAVRHGLALAESMDASVHALYVVPTGVTLPYSPGHLDEEGRNEAEEYGEEIVTEVVEMAKKAGIESTGVVKRGTVYKEIVEYAADNDFELLVMGTQGRSGLDELVLGSTTEKVVRHSDVPVTAVRRSRFGDWGPGGPGRG
jgi:nucleotide-binding universal stress UspA family protein